MGKRENKADSEAELSLPQYQEEFLEERMYLAFLKKYVSTGALGEKVNFYILWL